MGAKTMGAVLVLLGTLGAGTSLMAQTRYAGVGATASVSGPFATHCRRGRVRPSRERGPCAVPRRRAVDRFDAASGRAWTSVGWGSTRGGWRFGPGDAFVSSHQLKDAIGRRDYRRIRRHARKLGLHGPLHGLWRAPRYGPVVLEIRVERFAVARLLDRDRDGWTDVTLLRQFR